MRHQLAIPALRCRVCSWFNWSEKPCALQRVSKRVKPLPPHRRPTKPDSAIGNRCCKAILILRHFCYLVHWHGGSTQRKQKEHGPDTSKKRNLRNCLLWHGFFCHFEFGFGLPYSSRMRSERESHIFLCHCALQCRALIGACCLIFAFNLHRWTDVFVVARKEYDGWTLPWSGWCIACLLLDSLSTLFMLVLAVGASPPKRFWQAWTHDILS